ncbi:MAG: alanine racemase [Bdellovibrionales bacterium]
MLGHRETVAEIDLKAIQHNLSAIKKCYPDVSFICPMIKANAYGHGDIQVGRALQEMGLKNFGVALVEEGSRLRDLGFYDTHILTFSTITESAAKSIIYNRLTPVVSTLQDLSYLIYAARGNKSFPIHIKVDTGMHRMGLPYEQVERAFDLIKAQTSLELEGLCTHLSDAEDIGDENGESLKQLEKFDAIVQQCSAFETQHFHAFNSSGLVGMCVHGNKKPWEKFKHYGIRPGIAMYGGAPSSTNDETKKFLTQLELKPVMRIRSKIANIHKISKGEAVSYGSRWRAERPSVIATLPIGYADGVPRASSGKGHVFHEELMAPQVGTICMDYLMADITDWPDSKKVIGLDVDIMGGSQSLSHVDNLAKTANTISYEILAGISGRVPRQYLPTS